MLLCASEMKEFMKKTSETLFATRTWYEAENGSNGSYNFVFNSGPQVCSGLWLRKHAVKVRIFPESEIDKSVFTGWKRVFTRWKWTYLFQIDKAVFTGWKCVFTRWKWTYLFQTWEKFGTSRSVSEPMWVSLQVRKNSKHSPKPGQTFLNLIFSSKASQLYLKTLSISFDIHIQN